MAHHRTHVRHHAVHHIVRRVKKHKKINYAFGNNRKVKHRTHTYQTGKSITKIDRRYKAKKPGKRRAASGTVYYEHRRNRTDANQRERL
jgi:hypothetical protein